MDGLTPKQQAFIDAYIGEAKGNATEAVRIAGYAGNENTLNQTAAQNLRNPKISTLIKSRREQVLLKAEKRIVDTHEEFLKNLEFVSKLRIAAQEWLTHPDRDDAYSIDPRAEEIDVVYMDYVSDPPVRKVERLDTLLARLQEIGIPRATPFIKTVDLREYALKVVDRCDVAIDKFARLGGDYKKDAPNPADNLTIARKVVDAVVAEGGDRDEAVKRAVERYGVLAAELIG